jgi:hypothetical protein
MYTVELYPNLHQKLLGNIYNCNMDFGMRLGARLPVFRTGKYFAKCYIEHL